MEPTAGGGFRVHAAHYSVRSMTSRSGGTRQRFPHAPFTPAQPNAPGGTICTAAQPLCAAKHPLPKPDSPWGCRTTNPPWERRPQGRTECRPTARRTCSRSAPGPTCRTPSTRSATRQTTMANGRQESAWAIDSGKLALVRWITKRAWIGFCASPGRADKGSPGQNTKHIEER